MSDFESLRPPQRPAIIRKRKTPTKKSVSFSFGDGDVEEKCALELALVRIDRRIANGTTDRDHEKIHRRSKKRILVADEKIRLVCCKTPETRSTMCAKFFWLRHDLFPQCPICKWRFPNLFRCYQFNPSNRVVEGEGPNGARECPNPSRPILDDTRTHGVAGRDRVWSDGLSSKERCRFRRFFLWLPMWCPREEHQSQLSRVPRWRSIEPGTNSDTQCQAFAEPRIGLRKHVLDNTSQRG